MNETPLIIADPNKGIKVNSGIIAEPFRQEIREKVKELKQQGIGKLRIFTCEAKSSFLLTFRRQMRHYLLVYWQIRILQR